MLVHGVQSGARRACLAQGPCIAMALVTALLGAGLLISCAAAPQAAGRRGAPQPTMSLPAPTTPVVTMTPDVAAQRCIGGHVIGGGDTTPAGLADSPRAFVYSIRTDGGSTVRVSYTAVPPGPREHPQPFQLQFHAGTIRVGDYIKACGTYDAASATIVVARHGEYIETYAEQP